MAKPPEHHKWLHAERQDFHLAAGGGRPKNWIKGAISHPGSLRASLGVKEGHNIPKAKLNKAAHSSNPTTRRRAILAKTLGKMHHR